VRDGQTRIEAAADPRGIAEAPALVVDVVERLVINILEARSAIAMQAEALEVVKRHAELDPLTSLPNRILLFDRIAQAIAMADRNRVCCAVLFVDIDRFKDVNDRDGHAAGDRVLRNVAHRLLSCVRAVDTVCRIGGDEFVVLLTDVAGLHDIGLIAAKIVAALAKADADGSGVRVSIGISRYPNDAVNAEALIALADAAMYRSKRAGGGTYDFHVEDVEPDPRSPHAPNPPEG